MNNSGLEERSPSIQLVHHSYPATRKILTSSRERTLNEQRISSKTSSLKNQSRVSLGIAASLNKKLTTKAELDKREPTYRKEERVGEESVKVAAMCVNKHVHTHVCACRDFWAS